MNKKYRKIEYIKKDKNVNLVRLDSAYDNNCADTEYAEVSDAVLEVLVTDTRETENAERKARDYLIADAFDESNGTQIAVYDHYAVDSEQEKTELLKIFGMMSDCQRRRLYLHIERKMTYAEIAQIENVDGSAVYQSCKSALKFLHQYGDFLQSVSLKNWIELLNPTNL